MKNFLLIIMVIAAAMANTLSVKFASMETFLEENTPEMPAEVATETPTEAPIEVPTEIPTEVPTEAPAETPAEAADDSRIVLAAPIALSELCPGVEIIPMDFDDVTISVPADTYCQQGKKANGQIMLVLYEAMPTGTSFTANLTAVWNSQSTAYSEELVASIAEATEMNFPQIISQLKQQGIAASNMQLLSATTGSLGNLPTVDLLTAYDADYSGMGLELKTNLLVLQRTVLLGDKGMYVFTITAEDLSECVRLSSILNTLAWKE